MPFLSLFGVVPPVGFRAASRPKAGTGLLDSRQEIPFSIHVLNPVYYEKICKTVFKTRSEFLYACKLLITRCIFCVLHGHERAIESAKVYCYFGLRAMGAVDVDRGLTNFLS